MELKQERSLPLSRETVWQALNDPGVLLACIPGCESFDRVEDNTYDAVVKAKVGPVSARFKGRVTLEDLQPPASYSMRFEGQGGQAGFVKGSASVTLEEYEGGCTVGYVAHATLGGKLAQLGSRLVDSAARKTANDFFDNFVEHMGGGEEPADAGPAAPAAGSSRPWVWIAAGAVALVVILAVVLA